MQGYDDKVLSGTDKEWNVKEIEIFSLKLYP